MTKKKKGKPGRRIGTKLLFENKRIRVWEMTLRPGASSARHIHENDYVFVYTTGGTKLALYEDESSPPETSATHAGYVEFTEVGQGVRHRVKNVGSRVHKEVLVELKGPSRVKRPKEPATSED